MRSIKSTKLAARKARARFFCAQEPRAARVMHMVPGDDPVSLLDQRQQQVERACTERRRLLVCEQQPLVRPDLMAPEAIPVWQAVPPDDSMPARAAEPVRRM
jgi:hypothetical protein